MKIQSYFTSNIKKGVVHLIVLLIAIKIITITAASLPARTWDIYTIWVCLFAYYMHSLVFLPILIKKKNLKKYVLLTIVSFLIFTFAIIWFEAKRSSLITHHFDGTPSDPFDFFLNPQRIIGGLLVSLLVCIPFSILSLLYYVLIINKEERKELLSMKYAELSLNTILFISLFLLVFTNSSTIEYGIKNILELVVFTMFFYINTFVYTPIVLKTRNIFKYTLCNLISFAFIITLTGMIYGWYFIKITKPLGNHMQIIIFFLTTVILSFIYGYVRLKLKNNERLFHLKIGAKESELQLLKSQVNPHFLFNTLNTLYATALGEQATKTAESTAKLANLLRYMQNDIHKDFILLKNEISYLQDYIIIQKLRCAIEPEITTTFDNVTNQSISPGLLIPFVENAFKYGIDPSKKSELSISIICNENTIHFTCINSYNEDFKVHQTEEGFGIGIKNAQQRLQLVYPNKHTFEILKENNTFSVKLTITTKAL